MSECPKIGIPNIKNVRREIASQIEHQQSKLYLRPHVISPFMKAQEAFDAYSTTEEFSTFIHQMTRLTYCPPEEWDVFRASVRGRLNEMLAVDMLSKKASKRGDATVLDSSHSKPIIQSLFPDSKETDHGKNYGIESSSLRVGSIHLPSPDAMVVVRGNLRTFCETSLKEREKDWGYWRKKRARFRDTRSHFIKLGGYLYGLFISMNCNLVMTRTGYDNRKKMGLLRHMAPTEFSKLPYSMDEFNEFFDGLIPKNPPHKSTLQNPTHPYWKELIESEEFVEV